MPGPDQASRQHNLKDYLPPGVSTPVKGTSRLSRRNTIPLTPVRESSKSSIRTARLTEFRIRAICRTKPDITRLPDNYAQLPPPSLSPMFFHHKEVSTQNRCDTAPQETGSAADAQYLHDLARLRRVRDRIDREYEQPLNVEALARGVNMSAGHLSRQFRRVYGESPYSYLMTRRIERAMALLRRGDLTVTEVCFAVGCSSLGTFSTRFTELVGVPPSVYRRQAAQATAGIPACVAKQISRPIRNREAPVTEPQLS